jgi:two-component system alkaline phosphatase synthesis response regulator PhoP
MEGDQARVLLVDDDAALIRMMRLCFLTEGFEVLTARDGVEGLERLATSSVDVVILDLQMPRKDGRSFYRELRSRGDRTPVIILSAYGAEAARAELGAEACVSKPFDPEDLLSRTREVISRSSAVGSRGD